VNVESRVPALAGNRADLSGWLLIDKPAGMSSHDVLDRLRRRHRKVKMGHAGTLDPLATGLLLVAIGSSTRLVEATHALDKSYTARVRLGAVSSTDDADGEIHARPEVQVPEWDRIETALAGMTGPEVMQVPPAVSAIHVDGKRAYDLVRGGVEVRLAARPVRIDRITVNRYDWPWLDISVDCGAGTYMRSIARDLGESLGCGGLIETLRRTRIGPFHVGEALTLEAAVAADRLDQVLREPVEALTLWHRFVIDADQLAKIAMGQAIRIGHASMDALSVKEIALVDSHGKLVALSRGEPAGDHLLCRPYRVFVGR